MNAQTVCLVIDPTFWTCRLVYDKLSRQICKDLERCPLGVRERVDNLSVIFSETLWLALDVCFHYFALVQQHAEWVGLYLWVPCGQLSRVVIVTLNFKGPNNQFDGWEVWGLAWNRTHSELLHLCEYSLYIKEYLVSMETVSKQTDAFTQYTPFILQGHWKIGRTIQPSLFFSLSLSHTLFLQMQKRKITDRKAFLYIIFLTGQFQQVISHFTLAKDATHLRNDHSLV